jgi:transposase
VALLLIIKNLKIGIVKRSDVACGIKLLPERSIMERTLVWLKRCRRLARDWEKLIRPDSKFLRWASMRVMLKNLCQKQEQVRMDSE